MKKLLILIFAFGLMHTAMAQEKMVAEGPAISFEEKLFDFGVIVQGDTVEHTFVFENIVSKIIGYYIKYYVCLMFVFASLGSTFFRKEYY